MADKNIQLTARNSGNTAWDDLFPLSKKENVGLGSVENYAVASQAEAEAGTVADKYMTPQRTAQAIQNLAPEPTIASQAEAENGTVNDTFMTPLRTAQAINSLTTADNVTLTSENFTANQVQGGMDELFGSLNNHDNSYHTETYITDTLSHGNEKHTSTYATTTGSYAGLRAQSTTKADVGLSAVDNARQARSSAGYTIQKNGTDGSGIINFKTG